MATGKTLGSEAALAEAARLVCDALGLASFPFAIVRLDGECVGANRSLATMVRPGSEAAEVVGASLLDGGDEELGAQLARVSLGDPVSFECGKLPFGGKRRGRFGIQLAPFRVGAMVCGASVTIEDLTEQQVTAEALRAAELRFRALVESAGDGIGVHRGGTLLYVNPAAVKMLGYASATDVIGRPIMDFVHPDQHDRVRSHIAGLAHSGQAPIREETFVRADGTPVIVEVSASRANLEDGVATFVFFRDVTQRSRMRAELDRAGRMESLSRLAGSVAHDFSNLLTAVHGNLTLARLHASDPLALRPALDAALRETERAAELTHELLTFSRGSQGEASVLLPNRIVRDAVSEMRRRCPTAPALSLELDPTIGRVRIGAIELHQIALNVLLNACEAVDDGGVVTMRTAQRTIQPRDAWPPERAGLWVVLIIEDTGDGMDAATRARIFEPFFSTKRSGKGAGLGLSTVYGLVKQAGGWVDVHSEYGKGTRVEILLPLYQGEESDRSEPPTSQQPGGETVLVCDDESRLAMLTAGLLDQYGYGAVTVANCVEILDALGRDDPHCHVVLLDVNLPDGSASEVLAEMRTRGHVQPVILTSGYAEEDVPDELMRNEQVAGYLAKPYSVDRLVETVRAALDKADERVTEPGSGI